MSILQTFNFKEFQDLYLAGISRYDNKGCAIPPVFYYSWLRLAAAYVARRLDLGPMLGDHRATYEDNKDYTCWDPEMWCLKSIIHRPLTEIVGLNVQLGDHDPYVVHPSWVNIASPIGGQIVIIRGKTDSSIVNALYGWSRYFMFGSYTPLLFRLTVKAGFEKLFKGVVSTVKGTASVLLEDYPSTQDAMNQMNLNPIVLIGGFPYRVESVAPFTSSASAMTITVDKPLHDTLTEVEMVVTHYPEDLRSVVQQIAAIPIMATIGSWLHGKAGVTKDMGQLDALMRAKSLSVGKGFGPYSAQMEEMRTGADEMLRTLYDHYGPINVGAV